MPLATLPRCGPITRHLEGPHSHIKCHSVQAFVQTNPQTRLQHAQDNAPVVPINDTRTQCTTLLVLTGGILGSFSPRHHTTTVSSFSILGLYPAQILLRDISSICQVGFRLPNSLSEWIPFPQHLIPTSGTNALMLENPLNFILQSIPNQYGRWRLHLSQEFL